MKKKSIQKKLKEKLIWLPYVAGSFFIVLLALGLYQLSHTHKQLADVLIAREIKDLHAIFEKIDADCGITGFEHQSTTIDFLTVKSFVGSQVGSMNIMYPGNWQGPYKDRTPTIQEKQYQIVQAKDGIFIVPGCGVRLANKKVIGKDIVFSEDSNVKPLLKSTNGLLSKAGALGVQLKLKKHYMKQALHASSVKMMVSKDM